MGDLTDRAECFCADYRQPCTYHEGVEDGRYEERAAVVTLLLNSGLGFLAGLIEKGDHRAS